MHEPVLIGRGAAIETMPRADWEEELRLSLEQPDSRLDFMTEDHHRVRNMAVVDLAKRQRPLEPEYFADRLGLAAERVMEILRELERQLFFLVRNSQGSVSWAYPVTVDQTPHRLTFSTGERLHGA